MNRFALAAFAVQATSSHGFLFAGNCSNFTCSRFISSAFTTTSKGLKTFDNSYVQNNYIRTKLSSNINYSKTQLRMISDFEMPPIKQIGKMELEEIFEEIEEVGRDESGFVVIDVRNEDEIRATGKLNECVQTLPLPLIASANLSQGGAFGMDDEDFEEAFGFSKPSPDETIIFTCKAGIRSMHAAQFAGMNGFTNIINYSGGADEWFGMGGW